MLSIPSRARHSKTFRSSSLNAKLPEKALSCDALLSPLLVILGVVLFVFVFVLAVDLSVDGVLVVVDLFGVLVGDELPP